MVTASETSLAFLLAGGLGIGHVHLTRYEQMNPLSTPLAAISTCNDLFGPEYAYSDNPKFSGEYRRFLEKSNATCFPPLSYIPTITPQQARVAYKKIRFVPEDKINSLINIYNLSQVYVFLGLGLLAERLTNKFKRK